MVFPIPPQRNASPLRPKRLHGGHCFRKNQQRLAICFGACPIARLKSQAVPLLRVQFFVLRQASDDQAFAPPHPTRHHCANKSCRRHQKGCQPVQGQLPPYLPCPHMSITTEVPSRHDAPNVTPLAMARETRSGLIYTVSSAVRLVKSRASRIPTQTRTRQ